MGFIGLTLRAMPTMVSAAGVAGLRFADEATTANALVPQLRAQGADVIVVVIHEGGATTAGITETSCAGLSGDIVPILARLDPAVDVVVSGHTHRAYVCDYASVNPQRPFLLTSAGLYGALVTDIALRVDTRTRRVVRKTARQVIVQGEGFTGTARPCGRPADGAGVCRRRGGAATDRHLPCGGRAAGAAARGATHRGRPAAARPFTGDTAGQPDRRCPAGRHARVRAGWAQISFMNPGGVRADLVPDEQGLVRYGQLFAVQPFGNHLVVKALTGASCARRWSSSFTAAPTRPRGRACCRCRPGLPMPTIFRGRPEHASAAWCCMAGL